MKYGGMVFLLLAAGCGRPNYACDAKIPCPTSGHSYQFCSRDALGGCAYLTDDGKELSCRSCGDCTAATQAVAQWCTTSTSTTNPGIDSCTAPQFCQTSGARSYQFCSSSDGRSGCRYQTSDGQTLACANCTDCTGSAAQVSAWCGGSLTGGSTTGGTSGGSTTGGTSGGSTTGGSTSGGSTTGGTEQCSPATCPNGVSTYKFCSNGTICRYVASTGQSFYCSSCSNCSSAASSISSWCGGSTTGSTGGTTGSTTGGTTGTPMTGCNGYLMCLQDVGPPEDCAANATARAQDLLNALDECVYNACYVGAVTDMGTPACASDTDDSTLCRSCVEKSLQSGGVCYSSMLACANDKP